MIDPRSIDNCKCGLATLSFFFLFFFYGGICMEEDPEIIEEVEIMIELAKEGVEGLEYNEF